jgi:succinyl-CoA synthetase alpha subunit
MGWLTLISTLSGGVLGVGSTLVVEAVRTKRDQRLRHAELRRTAYVRYLTALTEAETALQTLALSRPTPVPRSEVVEAFRSTGVIAARYELFLVAPPTVYDAAREAYDLLRALRVAIATTNVEVGDNSSEWRALHTPYDTALRHLRVAMRDSLGPSFE